MFHRLAKRKMSAEEMGSARERELRLTVAQLREQLEEEKRARKRDHSDKVRELKAAREREQEVARETIEELKMKQLRERAQEMAALQEKMTKDFKMHVKEIQRKNEDEKQKLQKELEKEKRNFKEQRKAIEKEVQKQMRQAQESEQKKMAQEMFAKSSQLSDMEERLRDTQAADRTKAEVIREMKAEHHTELESLSHSSRLSSRQQLEELGASQREMREKDRKIASHLERIRRLEADKDKLLEEVRTLRRPATTPPSLTPSTSAGDITSQPPRQYTAKERDMVLKNTELSYRVCQLEEKVTELEKYKRELKELLEKAMAEQKPLKEQLAKQGVRVNSLNASLHDRERAIKRVTEENEELRKANRELTQEQAQQKRRLTQQMNQTHTQRMEHQRAIAKNTDLQKQNRKLHVRMKELEQQLRFNSHQFSLAAASAAAGGVVEPCSPSVSIASLASFTEDGSSEHVAAKYREMKTEYVRVKEHYKLLKATYNKLEQRYRLAEQEKLAMESEISQLRASPIHERDSPYDMVRSSTVLSDNLTRIEALQSHVKELEAYIIEQDKLVREERECHTREMSSLTEERDQLQERLQSEGWQEKREAGEGEEGSASAGDQRRQELLEQLSLVKEMNRKTSATVRQTKEKTTELEACSSEMDKTLQGMMSLKAPGEDGQEEGEEEEGWMEREASVQVLKKAWDTVRECQKLLGSGQDASQVVERLVELLEVDKPLSLLEESSLALASGPVDSSTPTAHPSLSAEIGRLNDELAEEKVAALQGLVRDLEQRLEEERQEEESHSATWDQEIATLQAQLSQKESHLKRVRRAIPLGVNEHMHQQLGHQVLHNLQQCTLLAGGLLGSETLLSELGDLETSLNSLLHTVFPGLFQQPSTSPLSSPSTKLPPPATTTMETSSPSTSLPADTGHELPAPSQEDQPSSLPTGPPPSDHPPAPSSQHSTPPESDNETLVTPLSSPSGSPTPTPPPQRETTHLPLLPVTQPPHEQLQSPPHSPPPLSPLPKITGGATPPHPVEEVVVMRQVGVEEISIPLSALFETTPTDSTHSEPHPSHTPLESPVHEPHESPVHASPESESQTTTVEEISQVVEQSEDHPSHIPMISGMTHEQGQSEEEQAATETIPKLGNLLFNGPSNPLTPDFTPIGGREYTKEDLEEVDLGTSGEYSVGIAEGNQHSPGWAGRESLSPLPAGRDGSLPSPSGRGPSLRGKDSLSPSLHYPTPPEAPAARQRVLAQAAAAAAASDLSHSSPHLFGKKRLRSQSMEQEAIREEEEREDGELGRVAGEKKKETLRGQEGRKRERLFVAILGYDPEAMCTTGRPEMELIFDEGAIIAVNGGVDESGFYLGSFQGRTGLVPAGFVQEMEVEDEKQRRRLLNQTLSRPHIPSLPSSPLNAPLSASRPASGSLLSPSGSFLTHSSLHHQHTPTAPSPPPPSSVTVESTRQKNVVMVTWTTPTSTQVTGYHIFASKQLRASVTGPQTRVLLSDVSEVSPVVVGVASHDQYGRQSSVVSTIYQPPPAPPSQPPPLPEQYRLCIVLVDYDPEKMSPSDNPSLELKVAEGNLLRCYDRDREESGGCFTMAELGESNKRGLVPTEFISEVYGPSAADQNKYEWKSPPQSCLPSTCKLMRAVYDYNSRQDSPNRGMELELSFRNGDTITVYGSIDSDGFYTGQVGEVFGLVPSNFLQEKEKEVATQRQQPTEEENKRLGKWELPLNMWGQMNGQELHLNALASSKARTESDVSGGASSGKKKRSAKPTENSLSGSGSGSHEEGRKRRWSQGIPLKKIFSRKKSDSVL